MSWTGADVIAARVRRRWSSGELLRTYAAGEPFPTISVALRGPKAGEIGDDLAAVRQWVRGLVDSSRDGRRYRLEWAAIGGRAVGRNQIPVRAHVETWEQAWALLGVQRDVRRFDELLALAEAEQAGPVRAWIAERPKRALELADDVPRLIAAWRWLEAHRGSGRYLREISAPGVDTKFVERHRGVLAEVLGVRGGAAEFLVGLGLAGAPSMVRLRLSLPLPGVGAISEVGLRVDELAQLDLRVSTVLVVENLVTYLSVPVPSGGAVLWGQGFDVGRLALLPWLREARIRYWGDLDAKGFEILNQLRAACPQTQSVLMDEETLLAHRDRWVSEPRPPKGAALTHLSADEQSLYRTLVEDRFGQGVRLEQERIDWAWASERLAID